jgi:hypothetical protein
MNHAPEMMAGGGNSSSKVSSELVAYFFSFIEVRIIDIPYAFFSSLYPGCIAKYLRICRVIYGKQKSNH